MEYVFYNANNGHYYAQNLLAWSLNPQRYTYNPSFKQYVQRSGHPFKSYPDTIWSPALFDREVNG